jgi:hypothetical protein
MNKSQCWNCGRPVSPGPLGDYGVICPCGIDLWAYPHKVLVEEDMFRRSHPAQVIQEQLRYAMQHGKPELLP